MSVDAAAKLPAIEHIKARKDGLDVLADIYRYAELGFDAIDPDDLALFRWYGIYTQRSEASAASGVAGPSEETDGRFMLRIKFPNGIVTSDQLRTVGRLSLRYGRGMGDITTRQNIQLHWPRIEDLPVVRRLPRLEAAVAVRGVGLGVHPSLCTARDQRHRPRGRREGRRRGLRRLGRRRARCVGSDGPPARPLRAARGGCLGRPGDHRD